VVVFVFVTVVLDELVVIFKFVVLLITISVLMELIVIK